MRKRETALQKFISAPGRKRNSAETKKAILLSARATFAQYGYDGVGVREIARVVGVTGIWVNRYFGSKEQLFLDVFASRMANLETLSASPYLLLREK
jgi:AcrR family transcriptional regulator